MIDIIIYINTLLDKNLANIGFDIAWYLINAWDILRAARDKHAEHDQTEVVV